MAADTFENLDLSSMATGAFSETPLSGTYDDRRGTDGIGETAPMSPTVADFPPQRDPGPSPRRRKRVDSGVTEIDLPDDTKIEPAVGWLVCIEGVDKGRSFRLVKGNNAIGRPGNGKTYAISLTDQAISRRGACGVIVYNERSNQFFITTGDLTNNINLYLNDEILLSPHLLSPRAVIEAAGDVLLFVPFCSDKFKWNYDAPKAPARTAAAAPADTPREVPCGKGHYYDPSVNNKCPFCAAQEEENDPDGVTRLY